MDDGPISTLQAAEATAASVLSGVRALRDAQLWQLSHTELLDAGRLLETIARTVYAAQLRFAGEVDDTALADQLSVSSTRVLLRNTLRISSGDAATRVRAAKLLLGSEPITGGQIPAALPQVAAALDDGAIGEGHVSVITQAVKAWPKTLDPDVWASAEQLLVDTARDGDPGEVSKAAQHLATGRTCLQGPTHQLSLDPDGDEPDDAEPECRMELHLGRRNPRTGLTPLKGLLDDEAVETFRQATDPLAAPHPEQNGVKDPRSPALRLAQAHLAALRGYLDAGDGPTVGGHVPHITMVLHYDALTKAIEDAALDFGGPIPPSTARRIACDAKILPLVVNGKSQVLDVGREQRLFTPTQRRVLAHRDRGCAWPGCTRPTGWTQAHHILSWLDGGPTDIDNGCLLCGFHHRQAHRSEWKIRMAADGRPEFIPPPWIDPRQVPQRNHIHEPVGR